MRAGSGGLRRDAENACVQSDAAAVASATPETTVEFSRPIDIALHARARVGKGRALRKLVWIACRIASASLRHRHRHPQHSQPCAVIKPYPARWRSITQVSACSHADMLIALIAWSSHHAHRLHTHTFTSKDRDVVALV